MFGIQPDGFAIGGFRFDGLSGRPQQHAEIAVRVGVLGIGGDRAPIRLDRSVEPSVGLQNDAEVAVPVRLIGREREAPADQREGIVIATLLMREYAGVVQRTRMIGCGLEHAAVNVVGLGELPVFLQKDRERNRFLKRQLARQLVPTAP